MKLQLLNIASVFMKYKKKKKLIYKKKKKKKKKLLKIPLIQWTNFLYLVKILKGLDENKKENHSKSKRSPWVRLPNVESSIFHNGWNETIILWMIDSYSTHIFAYENGLQLVKGFERYSLLVDMKVKNPIWPPNQRTLQRSIYSKRAL